MKSTSKLEKTPHHLAQRISMWIINREKAHGQVFMVLITVCWPFFQSEIQPTGNGATHTSAIDKNGVVIPVIEIPESKKSGPNGEFSRLF